MKNSLAILFSVIFLFFCSSAGAQSRVRADGMATIHKNLVDIARDKAIENAQRNAVEKAVGVMITSTSEVENYQLKLDRILSESRGFINTYKVISEKKDKDSYWVTIEADIGSGKLKDRMEAINLIIARKSKPRLMILFGETAQKDALAEAAMAKYFLSKGFKVVDAETVRRGKEKENLQNLASDRKAIADIAHRYGAEIVILGRADATSQSFNVGGIEMHSNKVIVSAKVVNGDTGEVLATENETKSAPGMKGDIKAITEEVSLKMARNMLDSVLERWSSELANTATVTLVASGLGNYEELVRFKDMIAQEVKGFKEMQQRAFHQGRVELDVELRGNTQGMADDVAAMSLNNRKMKILEISPNRIEVRLLP